jgi:hypothetical protein
MIEKKLIVSMLVGMTIAVSTGLSAQALHVDPSGDVGVGTLSPAEAVDVERSQASSRFQLTSYTDTANQAPQFIQRRSRGSFAAPAAMASGDNLGLISFRGHTGSDFTFTRAAITSKAAENWTGAANGSKLLFSTTPNGSTALQNVMEITHDGKVKINGTTLNVPDYVFEQGYELMPLDQLAEFVRQHKHLPGVAAAAEVNANGLDLAGSQLSLLEKVEELTLYTLQQHEELAELKSQNTGLRKRLAELEVQQSQVLGLVAGLVEYQDARAVPTVSMDH